MTLSLDDTVAAHLRAIAARDLTAYDDTLSDDVTVILGNGTVVRGREAVRDLHRDWFADTDWSLTTDEVARYTSDAVGVRVLRVDYRDVDEAGAAVRNEYLLSLTFARVDDAWRLVHDQNTFY